MIKLYQFAPAFGLPNASPFCMKVETYLRMAALPFEIAPYGLSAFQKAPKGKMPYIDDDGKFIADSSFIIDYLKTRHGDTLDAWLDPAQRATALAFQRLVEENLYWALVYTRWIQDDGWPSTRDAFFADLPLPLKWIVPGFARRGLRAQLRGQGMGRHSADEIMAIGKRDITALADFLGSKDYMMGAEPCSLDASAYASLANLLGSPTPSPLKTHALTYAQLIAYCERMRSRYYP